MVESFYPFLALMVSDGFSRDDCLALPPDAAADVFAVLRGPGARSFLSHMLHRNCGGISWPRFEAQLRGIKRMGITVISYRDADYPAYLRAIDEPPVLLFCNGSITALQQRGVAIVGTRKPSARGVGFTRNLARELSGRGIMIASGCARGIDTAAHQGALEGGADTVAVLGTGLDLPYPPENRALMAQIAGRGCVISEQPLGTPPVKFTFPRRNRLISALSHAVIVVEAGRRSGARITARWALEQGRDVGAVPGFPGDFRSQGVNALLKEGAFLVEGVRDVFHAVPLLEECVGRGQAPGPAAADAAPSMESGSAAPTVAGVDGELVRAIIDQLSCRPAHPDLLAEHLGADSATIASVLSALEIEGKIGVDMLGAYYVL